MTPSEVDDPPALAADPFLSAFVTANAGSGKTKTLIDRVARLLLAGAEPDQILCVTYTRAAAAEMQDRLFRLLGDWSVMPDKDLGRALGALEGRPPAAYEPNALSKARALFAQALETPGGLRIQTLHAFCEKLLRRFPLEAGVSPGFEVLDGLGAADLARKAHTGIARHALEGDGRIAQAYARLSVDLDHRRFLGLFDEFARLSSDLVRWFETVAAGEGVEAAVWTALTGAPEPLDPGQAEADLVDVSQGLAPGDWLRISEILMASPAKTEKGRGEALQASQGRPTFDQVLSMVLTQKWTVATWFAGSPRLKPLPDIVDLLDGEANRLLGLEMRRRMAVAGQRTLDILILAQAYLTAYETEKTLSGKLDFSDLVGRTVALTRTAPMAAWVLYKLDQRLAHILVDEAQDTAPDQWGILRGLTGDYFSGAGQAVRGNGPGRSFFVVGDVKQSIYSFQGASPENLGIEYAHHSQAAAAVGARFERIDLTRSWRSVPEVLTFVDAVFAGDERAQALVSVEGETPPVIRHEAGRKDPGCVDLWDLVPPAEKETRDAWQDPPDALGTDSSPRILARRMVSEIRQIVSRGESIGDKETKGRRPASWGDILILVRRRGALFDEILRELKRSGVPVGGADRLKLSEHILFEDLRGLVRFALFPGDDLTLAALLRSPFCDVTDESLFDLARDRPDPTLWDTLKRRAGDGRSDWAQAADFLGRVARTGAGHTPYDFIVGILESPGPCGRSQRQRLLTRLGREAEEALGVFLEKTLELEQAGSRHLESYAADLDRLDVDVAREMDAAGADEVRIMTAHGAKGLEAPIVILPDMTFSDPGRAGLVRTDDGTFLWLGSGDEDCKAQAGAREDRSRDSGRELNRLLYVGLTRARDRLILCGILPGNRDEDKLKGWWSAVSEAFADRLGDGVRRIERDDFSFRRFGPDPEVLGPAGAGAPTVVAAVPPWLGQVARAEPLSRLASPSDLGDSAPVAALSPLAGLGGLGRFRRGELIHRLLQILPDLDSASWDRAARRLLEKEAGLTADQVSEMTAAALGVLQHPEFAFLFGPGSRAEAGIVGGAASFPEGLRISGRIDRLVVRDDEVLFADFKTNRPAPARIEDADPAYLRQLAMYWAVLGDLYPGRKIRAALVWTDGPRLTPAPEPLLRSALEALREGFR